MKFDFVFLLKIALTPPFGFAERTVIGWSEPLIFGFPPKSFRQIQMLRILRQKEDLQIFFNSSCDRRQEQVLPVDRRIV